MGRDGPECNLAVTEGLAALEMLIDDTNEWDGLKGRTLNPNIYNTYKIYA